MAKINIGDLHDQAKQKLDVKLSSNSQMELTVGAGYDMSERQIRILEQQQSDILAEVNKIRKLVEELEAKQRHDPRVRQVYAEARTLSDQAKEIVENRKWCSISAAGLIAAAKALGDMASPIVDSSLKVIDLLQKLHGV